MSLSEPAKRWMPNRCFIVSFSICVLSCLWSQSVVVVAGDSCSLLVWLVILRCWSLSPLLNPRSWKWDGEVVPLEQCRNCSWFQQSPTCVGPWLTNIILLEMPATDAGMAANCKVLPPYSDNPFSPGFRIRGKRMKTTYSRLGTKVHNNAQLSCYLCVGIWICFSRTMPPFLQKSCQLYGERKWSSWLRFYRNYVSTTVCI